MNLDEKIKELEERIKDLEGKSKEESTTEIPTPYAKPGQEEDISLVRNIDISSGRGKDVGGQITWNNSEATNPLYGTQPATPTVGYNKHSHSRYSGGALIKDVLEIVDYDWGATTNKHSQGYLKTANAPTIKKEINTKGVQVDKIGLLDLVFNPDTQTWGVASLEIDIKKCYFVQRDSNGDIELDSKNQQMKAPLYNADTTKTSIVWDESGNCWRLYCAYAPGV